MRLLLIIVSIRIVVILKSSVLGGVCHAVKCKSYHSENTTKKKLNKFAVDAEHMTDDCWNSDPDEYGDKADHYFVNLLVSLIIY